MLENKPSILPIVYTIAGADSSGGAGIQADLHTFHDFAVHAGSVITALTAQNSQGISHIEYVSSTSLSAQLTALTDDMPPCVIKLGMLGNRAAIHTISRFLASSTAKVVCDPVINATVGTELLALADLDFYKKYIFPHVDILTPNIPEVEQLLGCRLTSPHSIERAAQQLLQCGVKSVVIKGGHSGTAFSQDYYTDGYVTCWLTSSRQQQVHTHGSGCSFASALAAALALNFSVLDALVIAKMYINQGIRAAQAIGRGRGAIVHLGWPKRAEDLPWLTSAAVLAQQFETFPAINHEAFNTQKIGLYPIVPTAAWIERLAKLGVNMLQLRIKSDDQDYISKEIVQATILAKRYGLRLFINDHWQQAIHYSAYGVHLGQEDLALADIPAIRQAGLRLGISTHGYAELARAHAYRPSYIAYGPIFPTSSKPMTITSQGVKNLRHWRKIVNYPLVAIGGIQLDNCKEVLACGVDGVAVISAITQASDVTCVVAKLQTLCKEIL